MRIAVVLWLCRVSGDATCVALVETWSLQGVICMSFWLGDVWNGFFDFVSEESREQQIKRALKARKGCVGRSGKDTLVARWRARGPRRSDDRHTPRMPVCRPSFRNPHRISGTGSLVTAAH